MKASANLGQVKQMLREYEADPLSAGFEWRLELADFIMDELDRKGWSQQQLADASGITAAVIEAIVCADVDCTFSEAGRLLHAMDVKATLVPTKVLDRLISDRTEDVGLPLRRDYSGATP